MDLATSDTDQAIFELDLAISGTELTEQQEDGQICEPCVESKQTRMIHHEGGQKTTRKLELVHSDLWGPHYPASFRGKHYAIVLEDDFTKKSWIGFLTQKSDAYEYFKNWHATVVAESGYPLTALRVDGGGEFMSIALEDHCKIEGISIGSSAPYTPEHNGSAERAWRTIRTMKDSMLIDSGLSNRFWAEAMDTANYIRNRLPARGIKTTPEQAWTGQIPYLGHLRIFGSTVYAHIPKEKRQKSDVKRTWTGILIGYMPTTKQIRVWSPTQQNAHAISAYSVDERRKGADLLTQHPLPPPIDTLQRTYIERAQPDAPKKRGRPRKQANNATDPLNSIPSLGGGSIEQDQDMSKRIRLSELSTWPVREPSATKRHGMSERRLQQLPSQANESGIEVVKDPATSQRTPVEVAKDPAMLRRFAPAMDATRGTRGAQDAEAAGVTGVTSALKEVRSGKRSPSTLAGGERAQLGHNEVVRSGKRPSILARATEAEQPGHSKDPDGAARKTIDMVDVSEYPGVRESLLLACRNKGHSGPDEPRTYVQAVTDPVYGRQWRDAVDEELQNLSTYQAWRIERLPEGRKLVGCKWVFKIKRDENGQPARYKARLVAQGFSQIHGIDYEETFAPTVRRESLRMFLAIVAAKDMELHQMDIVAAYLASELGEEDEQIFMRIPEGVLLREGLNRDQWACRIIKSLYGLKQSARKWREKLVGVLRANGYSTLNGDPSILISSDGRTIISTYVDDLLLAAEDPEAIRQIKALLQQNFDTKDLGEARMIVGMRIRRDRVRRRLWVDQTVYLREILATEGMTDCNAVAIPMKPGTFIALDEEEDIEETNIQAYQTLIGKLLYLACGTRPDISFCIGCLSQQCADPRIGHLKAARKVLRYLKGTAEIGLEFGVNHVVRSTSWGELQPYGYADASFAGDLDNRKSTTGHLFLLDGAAISWTSKRQRTVSTSSTEAEYLAIGAAARQAVWIRRLLNEFGAEQATVTLYGDNEGCLKLIRNPEQHDRTKHIDIQHHYVRQLEEEGEIQTSWVSTKDMLADGLTKALPRDAFVRFRTEIGLVRIKEC